MSDSCATTRDTRPMEVASADVEAMIQLLLTAPVADEAYLAPADDDASAIAALSAAGSVTSAHTT